MVASALVVPKCLENRSLVLFFSGNWLGPHRAGEMKGE